MAVISGFADVIGLTENECRDLFGTPVYVLQPVLRFEKDGMVVKIEFDVATDQGQTESSSAANRGMPQHQTDHHTGKAIQVTYSKQQHHTYFTEDEVNALLAANAGPVPPPPDRQAWTLVGLGRSHKDYKRFDNQACARVYNEKHEPTLARKIRITAGGNLPARDEEDRSRSESGD